MIQDKKVAWCCLLASRLLLLLDWTWLRFSIELKVFSMSTQIPMAKNEQRLRNQDTNPCMEVRWWWVTFCSDDALFNCNAAAMWHCFYMKLATLVVIFLFLFSRRVMPPSSVSTPIKLTRACVQTIFRDIRTVVSTG